MLPVRVAIRTWYLALLLLGALAHAASGQAAAGGSRAEGALRVFIDCQRCQDSDFDFFRTEITFVDFVRVPEDAGLHILITEQETGSGGSLYTLAFLGRGAYATMQDTLSWSAEPAASQDAVRHGLTGVMKLGLVRYAARTPAGAKLTVGFEGGSTTAAPPAHDPWNAWVFEIGGDLFLNGEQTFHSADVSGNLSARRVTERWKLSLGGQIGFHKESFQIDDTTTVRSDSHFSGLDGLLARSLGPHWSLGVSTSVSSSSYVNQDLAVQVAPGIEYDLFPYGESTRRLIVFRYAIGVAYYNYTEQTLYDLYEETRGLQSLTVSAEIRQPFGSINASLLGSNYLYDWSKNRLQLSGSLDVRLIKGLSLRLFGDVSLIHDQLYLPKEGATEEEVLLRRRQLATGYRYFTSIGLSYTFGSIYNNIVNPRFGSGSRFFF